MKAIVLAAGKGDRFHPFSHYRPKPMFPICNRPLLEWVIERIVAAGIRDVGIVVGHRHGRIRSHFSNGRRFGCEVTYIEQPEQLGTAHAVCAAADFIGTDDFLVAYGDLFFEQTVISQLLDGFTNRSVAAVHHSEQLNRRIRIETDTVGNVVDYTWKPRSSTGTALSGLFVFRNDALQDLGNTPDFATGVQNGVTPPEGHEIAEALALMNREGRPAAAVRADGVCFDMDMPWEPLAVCRLAAEEMARRLEDSSIAGTARVDPDAHIDGPVFVDEGAAISRGARISGPAWIGRNTHVFEGLPDCLAHGHRRRLPDRALREGIGIRRPQQSHHLPRRIQRRHSGGRPHHPPDADCRHLRGRRGIRRRHPGRHAPIRRRADAG